jgi:hypothetical protein
VIKTIGRGETSQCSLGDYGGDCLSLDGSCVLLRWSRTTGHDCVSLDNSCVLLWWLCTTGGDCVSLDNSCVLLWWLCTTSSDCVLDKQFWMQYWEKNLSIRKMCRERKVPCN